METLFSIGLNLRVKIPSARPVARGQQFWNAKYSAALVFDQRFLACWSLSALMICRLKIKMQH